MQSMSKKTKTIGIVVSAALIVAGGLYYWRTAQPVVAWEPELGHLKDRLSSLGFPALTAEGTAVHIHEHLDIFVHGKRVLVPANIGVNQAAGFISPVHTHDTTGVIHIESSEMRDYTLGQFFEVWGTRLTPSCLGNECAREPVVLKVFVGGQPYVGNPRNLVLTAHQEIVLVYGAPDEMPSDIPATFLFDPGL